MKKIFTFLFTILLSAQMWASTGSWSSGSATVALADDGTITITGLEMANYPSNVPEWIAYSSQITKVEAKSSVTKIGSNAFRDCINIASVELNNPNLTLGLSAFYGCSKLTSITLPENITEISQGLFCKTGLTSITIPASVTAIGRYAFFDCDLEFIRCKAEVPPTIADATAFENVPRNIPLYVPFSSLDAYKAADVWKEFNVLPDPEQCPAWGNCGLQGDNLTWSLDCEGQLIISGTGAMNTYEALNPQESTAPWNFQTKDIKTIIVSEGVTTIGAYAFYRCENATSVTLPNSLLSIGRNAFNHCQHITDVIIPSSVATIGMRAFAGCIRLASVRILGATSIDNTAFKDCSALTSILCASEIPPTCDANAFSGLSDEKLATILLSVPGKAIADYQAHAVWGKFDIQASAQKKIQFVNEAGEVLKTEMLDEGAMPNAVGLSPTKAADEDYVYEFLGWLPALHDVTEDYIYVTQFVRTPKKFFNATVGGENCSLEVTTKLPEGAYLYVTVNPDECYNFQQWSDGNKDNPRVVSGDMNVSAELNKIKFKVTDNSQNGQLNIAPQE